MKFEMPKMNVAIFSLENVVTTSNANLTKAKQTLIDTVGVDKDNITVVSSADAWQNA